jgi:hypothetical protein
MADSKLSALNFGTSPGLFYGEEASVSKKYSGNSVFNVQDFGATGNGSTNDAAAINAAIAACFANGGGTVWFPVAGTGGGVYNVGSTSIVCPATPGGNVCVCLAGPAGLESDYSRIIGNNPTGYILNLDLISKTGVTRVENLHIINQNSTAPATTNVTAAGPAVGTGATDPTSIGSEIVLTLASAAQFLNQYAGASWGLIDSAVMAGVTGLTMLNGSVNDVWPVTVSGNTITLKGSQYGSRSTVTISNASPAVIGWTNHGLVAGAPVTFTSSGTLPTGINSATQYYVMATNLHTNDFQISTTVGGGGSAINTTSAGSGTFTATSTGGTWGGGGTAIKPIYGSGSLRIGNGTVEGVVQNCVIEITKGVGILAAFGQSGIPGAGSANFYNCQVKGPGSGSGNVGIMTQQSVIAGCRITFLNTGVWANNNGITIIGSGFEVNNTALYLGYDPNANRGWSALGGGLFAGLTFESNTTAIQIGSASALKCSGLYVSGFVGGAGTRYNNVQPATGIVMQNVSGCVFDAITITGDSFTNAALQLIDDNNGGIDGIVFSAVKTGGWPVIVPTTNAGGGSRRGFKCIKCDFSDVITYSMLPTSNQIEGDEYNISNATVPTFLDQGGTAHPLVGGTVTGSGSTHAKVRWNGTNWTFVGA